MITFILSLVVLLAGYFIYSRVVEKIFGMDANRQTPAYKLKDDVDYVPMSWWRIFLIQFLNIAGLGPIFGALAGAMFGPVALLWIVFGSIFGGAVHDYFSGMLSIKHDGLSITEIIGIYLGKYIKQFVRVFTVGLTVMVGAIFVMGPAKILAGLTTDVLSMTFWIWAVFTYYIMATLLPIDKLIGRIYPIFGFCVLFMAVGLITSLFVNGYNIPELSLATIGNFHSSPEKFPVIPMMFISIACGAFSGFHATQSPLMSRCLKTEKHGRRVFYGAMISESVVALIWAVIGMSFYGGIEQLNVSMNAQHGNAAYLVNQISNTLLGKFGAVLALLGVVAAPITSGDTAFRSARLILADLFNYDQGPFKNRILLCIPLFGAGIILTATDFGVLWRYFAWSNQTLGVFVLWAITVYLAQEKKFYWITLVPALFMTFIITSYMACAPEGFALPLNTAYLIGLFAVAATFMGFQYYRIRFHRLKILVFE